MDNTFVLFQPQIFSLLADGGLSHTGEQLPGKDWFSVAIAEASMQFAATYGCEVEFSKRRLDEAHYLWLRDVERIDFGDRGNKPDAFKRAGILAYWLRRRLVIADVIPMESVAYDTPYGQARRDRFVMNGAEIIPFLIGYNLSKYFSIALAEPVETRFRGALDEDFVWDVGRLLRINNVSPHALYLLYRALCM